VRPLFNYTGKTVVGLKAWEKAKMAELKHKTKTLRHGRRLAKHKTWESLKPNKAPQKNKPRSFQRIETLVSGTGSPPTPTSKKPAKY
jgi:hypothetical protein